MERRRIGNTSLEVSPVALGCWPISGMTSLDVNEHDSLRTIEAALELGINFLDTAYCYGRDGESERLIGRAIRQKRDSVVIATKGGIHWGADGQRVFDGSPDRLRQECQISLKRLDTDYVDLLYLHAPDPNTPIEDSARAMSEFVREGITRTVGVSNVSLEQLKRFHSVCPVAAIQPAYNMILRDIEQDLIPWCQGNDVAVIPYWPLMKGLLAGKLTRDHQFPPGDGRAKYPMFQGDEWRKNHDLMDQLQSIAADMGRTVAQLVVNWTINQPGITSALCGAKRDRQIEETAGAMGWTIGQKHRKQLDAALARRGTPVSATAV